MSLSWPWNRRRRRNFRVHPSAVLYESASVVNNQEDDAISVGAHTHVRGELLTFGHGGAIQVGEYCYVGEQTRIWSARRISIGNRVLIAHQVNIFDNSTHPLGPRERHEQFRMIITSGQPKSIDLGEMPVTIEDDAWIGCMSIVLPGVTIGAAAVVGAGSVVTESVAPYTVVAGNPARFVRKIERNG